MTTASRRSTSKEVAIHKPQSQGIEPDISLNWDDVASAVFTAQAIDSGWWRFGVKLRMAALTARMGEPSGAQIGLPTALVAVEGVALFRATEGGDLVYDAATRKAVPHGATLAAKTLPVRKKALSQKRTATK